MRNAQLVTGRYLLSAAFLLSGCPEDSNPGTAGGDALDAAGGVDGTADAAMDGVDDDGAADLDGGVDGARSDARTDTSAGDADVLPSDAGEDSAEATFCEPGARVCQEDTSLEVCSDDGSEWVAETCGVGHRCAVGGCHPVRHNVVLVFDTSGSMTAYADRAASVANCDSDPELPCPEPFPVCELADEPLSLLTYTKLALSRALPGLADEHVRVALARFPQVERLGVTGNCFSGWYGASEDAVIEGDDDAWETVDEGWFDENLHQFVASGFPATLDDSGLAELARWMDLTETARVGDIPCELDRDCASGGCGQGPDGVRGCLFHDDPELRPAGQTPLGKSLFYAGEYLRRHVVIDGRACVSDEDCPSAGYRCGAAGCENPYASCIDHHVVLLTDGNESQYFAQEDFFNPAVQAKRLAFGLDCATAADCRGGATCEAGVCLPPGLGEVHFESFPAGDGFGALSTADGAPLRVRTSVLRIEPFGGPTPSPHSELIAEVGDGSYATLDLLDEAGTTASIEAAFDHGWSCGLDDP